MSDVQQYGEQPETPEQSKDSEEPMAAASSTTTSPGQPMPKNIIVCCDGTGNEFIGEGAGKKKSKNSNSNIVKLYTALQLDYRQIAYYHPGVGTMGDPTKKGLKRAWSVVAGLAFGSGFEDNVLDAYRYLMQHYNAGDVVYIFGFSRGAYTARALAGLLHGYGLLCRGNEGHIPYAWRMYTAKVQEQLKKNGGAISTDYSFRDTFSHKEFMIRFVGLFDTVSSVGWISTPLRLLHLAQNPTIMYGRHAVSLDERRCFYQDNLWGKPVAVEVPPWLNGDPQHPAAPGLQDSRQARDIPDMQDIRQVWFSGVHSDVGGSYAQDESGLSNITLTWMMDEAEKLGVRFRLKLDPARRAVVLGNALPPGADPKGELTSLVPIYTPATVKLHDSFTWPWWPLEIFPHRYYTSDDGSQQIRIPLGARRQVPPEALIHPSVKAHLDDRSFGYKPKNLKGELAGPNAEGYYTYVPKARARNWRENPFVVLLVSLLELALGLVVALWLLKGLAHACDWVVQLAVWLRQEVLPRSDFSGLSLHVHAAWSCLRGCVAPHWHLWHRLWPFALAAAIMLVHFLFSIPRRLKSRKEARTHPPLARA